MRFCAAILAFYFGSHVVCHAQDSIEIVQSKSSIEFVTIERQRLPTTEREIRNATRALARLADNAILDDRLVLEASSRESLFEEYCGFVPDFEVLLSELSSDVPRGWHDTNVASYSVFEVPPCAVVKDEGFFVVDPQTPPQLLEGFPELTSIPVIPGASLRLPDRTLNVAGSQAAGAFWSHSYRDTPDSAGCRFTSKAWPYNEKQLYAVLKTNDELRKREPKPVVIGIVDSGLTQDAFGIRIHSQALMHGCPVPEEDQFGYETVDTSALLTFSINEKELNDRRCKNANENYYVDDIIGVSVGELAEENSYDSVLAFPDHKFAKHGTSVALMALGGWIQDTALADVIGGRLQLKIVKIAKDVPNPENTAVLEYPTPPSALYRAVEYLAPEGEAPIAQVINISNALWDDPLDKLLNAIKDARREDVVVVTAAGNTGNDLSSQTTSHYPARYGGRRNVNVITVAASDKDGGLYEQSSRDAQSIDIAAPGCDVLTYGNNGWDGPSYAAGTSFSSPLTAFVVALLKFEGLEKPKLIKRRLHDSSDFDWTEDSLRSVMLGGRVNVPKALSLWTDLIETRGGAGEDDDLRFGFLESIQKNGVTQEWPCGIPIDTITKVAIDPSQRLKTHRVYHGEFDQDIPQRKSCQFGSGWQMRFVLASGELLTLPMNDVLDFVRHRFPSEDVSVEDVSSAIRLINEARDSER